MNQSLDSKATSQSISMSSPQWRQAVQSTALYNTNLLQEKRCRGPFYHDIHSNTIQVNDSYELNPSQFGIPSIDTQEYQKDQYFKYCERKLGKSQLHIISVEHPKTKTNNMMLGYQSGFKMTPHTTPETPKTPTTKLNPSSASTNSIASKSVLFHQQQQNPIQTQTTTTTNNAASCDTCKKSIQSNGSDSESILLCCKRCKRVFHPRFCLSLSNRILGRIKQLTPPERQTPVVVEGNGCILNYEWECKQCKLCMKCGHPATSSNFQLCNLCNRAIHSLCLTSQNSPLQSQKYLCASCIAFTDAIKQSNRQVMAARAEKLTPPKIPTVSIAPKGRPKSVFAESPPRKKAKHDSQSII